MLTLYRSVYYLDMSDSKSARTRQYIITQSSPVFNTKGYAGTSLQDIMDVTGLTKGGIYGNFKNKEEIAFQVFDYNVGLIMNKVALLVRKERNAIDKLNAIIKFYKNYYFAPTIAGGCPMLNLAIEADDTHPGFRLKVVEALNVLRDSIIHILKKGKEYDQIKPDIDVQQFATVFLAMVEGGIMMARTFQEAKYLSDCMAHLSGLVANLRK